MRPKRLLSSIEYQELYEAKRGIGGYDQMQTPEHYVQANLLLQSKGLIQVIGFSESTVETRETDEGTEERFRYLRLPRYEDELIQAIDYLETYHSQLTLTVNDQTYPIPSDTTLSETLIMLAAMLRDMAGAK